jgi:glycosyltransferase involved in cell wall biosynthesis
VEQNSALFFWYDRCFESLRTVFESAQRAERPTVSVVVVSYNTPRTLEKCLASLSRQPAAEILVMDCSDRDPGVSLGARFPTIVFRHFPEKLSIPQLRRAGIHASKGEIVALTESWMEPCPNWVESLRGAHQAYPDAAVVGGPIGFPCDGAAATGTEWADYFSEYGEHIPEGDTPEVSFAAVLSGANASYKRWALEECRDLIDEAAWEPLIHSRLLARGHKIRRASGALVCYRRPARLGDLLKQRFSYGRGHGVGLGRGKPWIVRVARGAAAPLVPWVLLWRQWRGLPPVRGLWARFLAASASTLALNTAWALGEAAGSWFGPAKDDPAFGR